MSSRQDPRVERLLEKTTLENLFKLYFQRVYGEEEVGEMERVLKNILKKYEGKGDIFQALWENNEKAVKSLMDECSDTLCEQKTFKRGKKHTPESLLMLGKLFIKIGDCRLACEVIWGAATLTLQGFITERQLNVKLYSHNGKANFAREISDDIGRRFIVFESCHSSFYTNNHDARRVNAAFKDANEFIRVLRGFHLTEEKKKQLEKNNTY